MTQAETSAAQKRVISLGRARVIGVACLPLLLFALFFARFAASQKLAPGLTLAGVKVGGLSRDETKRRLAERAAVLAKEKLRVALGSKESSVTVEELGLELLVDDSASRAMTVARNSGVLSNAFRYLRSAWTEETLPAALRVDGPRFDSALAKLEAALIDDPPVAAGITVENGVASAIAPRAGRKIPRDSALAACLAAVGLGRTQAVVTLAASTLTPALEPGSLERALALASKLVSGRVTLEASEHRLTIEPAELGALLVSQTTERGVELKIDPARVEAWLASRRASLEAEARDASFEVSAQDEVRVVPARTGLRLASDAVARALFDAAQRDERRGELPLVHEPLPARSTEQAEKLGIHSLVGSFTTRHPCCQPRVDNIHRIATLLDGLVVEPGQTASLNAIVGPRTQKNGFVLAPSIEDGEMVDTVGGGVSQFATTIFNALFHAGYDIIERQPHSYWFPRYPMGHDATLGIPRPDIVFKNDSAAGLLVKTSFTKTSITVKIYGDVGGRRVSSSVSERREIVQPALEYLPNRDVAPDEEKVKEGGMIGWSVIASRTITFADGTKKEEKRKVTYKPKPRRVEVHPCKIPKGEPGATGERCPEPPPEETDDAADSAHAAHGE